MNGFQTTKSVLSTRTWRTDLDKFFKSFDLETSSMAASIFWALWNSKDSLLWMASMQLLMRCYIQQCQFLISWKGSRLVKADACNSTVSNGRALQHVS